MRNKGTADFCRNKNRSFYVGKLIQENKGVFGFKGEGSVKFGGKKKKMEMCTWGPTS